MLKKTVAVASLLAAIATPVLASDDAWRGEREHSEYGRRCQASQAAQRLSIAEVAQKLKEQGYTLRKIEVSHGCYEVKGTDAKGNRVKMYIDPATAEIVRSGGQS